MSDSLHYGTMISQTRDAELLERFKNKEDYYIIENHIDVVQQVLFGLKRYKRIKKYTIYKVSQGNKAGVVFESQDLDNIHAFLDGLEIGQEK